MKKFSKKIKKDLILCFCYDIIVKLFDSSMRC